MKRLRSMKNRPPEALPLYPPDGPASKSNPGRNRLHPRGAPGNSPPASGTAWRCIRRRLSPAWKIGRRIRSAIATDGNSINTVGRLKTVLFCLRGQGKIVLVAACLAASSRRRRAGPNRPAPARKNRLHSETGRAVRRGAICLKPAGAAGFPPGFRPFSAPACRHFAHHKGTRKFPAPRFGAIAGVTSFRHAGVTKPNRFRQTQRRSIVRTPAGRGRPATTNAAPMRPTGEFSCPT